MAETKIEYADYTANAWRGCSKVHAGCQHCYAETLANRFPETFGRWGAEKQGGVRVVADLDKLFRDVSRWDKKAQEQEAQQQAAAPAQPAAAPVAAPPAEDDMAAKVEALKQLAALKDQGILTDDEFAAQKAKILG